MRVAVPQLHAFGSRLMSLFTRGCAVLVLMSASACGGSSIAPATGHSAVGTWSGVLVATSITVSNASGATLSVTLTIAQAGPSFAGSCADGTPMQSFGALPTNPAPNQVGLRGACDGLIFQAVYDSATDRLINVIYRGDDYGGTLTRTTA